MNTGNGIKAESDIHESKNNSRKKKVGISESNSGNSGLLTTCTVSSKPDQINKTSISGCSNIGVRTPSECVRIKGKVHVHINVSKLWNLCTGIK